MPLNNQQRDIINPYAEEETEYSYTDLRNRFVLDAIHESYTSYFTLLPINKILKINVEQLAQLGIERNINNLIISRDDLLAYEILYPQNCSSSANIANPENELQQVDFLKVPDVSYSNQKLSQLVDKLETRGVLDLYLSDSSPTAILPENVNNIGPQGHVARLVAVPPNHSNEYLSIIKNSLDLENEIVVNELESINNLAMSSMAASYVNSDNNIDIYDWRQNCLPGDDTEKIYYNPIDDSFYFTKRTDKSTSQLFDVRYRTMDGATIPMVASSIKLGISEILKHTNRYSEESAASLYQDQLYNFLTHMDIRPGSRWQIAVKIERKYVERIDRTDVNSISYEEFEYTALEKAKILINPELNKTAIKSFQKVESIVRYLPSVIATVARYSKQLKQEQIFPKQIGGINLALERSILDSFVDNLSLAFLHNNKPIKDEDVVQFCFTDGYKLEYFVVNGYVMTRGIGNKTFFKPPEGTEPPKTIMNVFSRMTSTSFSIIKNSYQIYNDDSIRSDDSNKPWPIFFEDYIFPAVELEYSKLTKGNKKEEQRRKRRNSLYTKISDLAKDGAEIEQNMRRINPDRYPFYQVTTIFTDLDCDSAQYGALKEALKFWQALNGKTKIRNLVRQSIMTIRNELINESLEKSILTGALRAEDNPRLFIREIERAINDQIFCGLDVMGNVIETQFLDAKNMNPLDNAGGKAPGLGQPIKFELKIPKGAQRFTKSSYSKKADLYEEMVEQVILGFLNTIFMGICKDLIKAVLGCGEEEVLNDTLRNIRFGYLDLNEYLLDVDVVEVAKEANLVNVTRSQVDGQEVITKTDPTLTQITQLISDVSKMCTPSELDRLTFGEADNILYELILETVENGVISFLVEEGTDETREELIDPTVYENLEFSLETIKEFFLGLGDAMRGNNAEELAKFSFSPLQAFCQQLDPDVGRLNLNLSIEQIEDQYNNLAQSKINKINEMCDILRSLENIEREIQRLVDSLPVMDYYNNMLATLSKISNGIFETLAAIWNDLFDEDLKKTQDPEYNIYLTNLGQQLFFRVGSLINRAITACEQVRATDDEGQFYYQSPLKSRQYERKWSPLTLPFPPPTILSPGGLGRDDALPGKLDQEAAYALRSGPYELRQDLNAIPRPPVNEDDVLSYYTDLSLKYDEWKTKQGEVTPSDRWISLTPQSEKARIRLSVNNPEQGGVFLSRIIKRNNSAINKPYFDYSSYNTNLAEENIPEFPLSVGTPDMYETVIVAQYIPEIGDAEPANSSVNYYQLLNGIGAGLGGPLDAGAFTNSVKMPSRNNSDITKIINNSLQGIINYSARDLSTLPTGYLSGLDEEGRDDSDAFEKYIDNIESQLGIEEDAAEELISDLTPDIDSISISNWIEYIDQQLNARYTQTKGRQYLTRYMKFINAPVFTANDDVCITMEDMDIASSIVMTIQSRIQIFLLNVCHLTRVYPNWNSLGTTKIITDYLFRKINNELSRRELVNLIYSKLDVFEKVYSDTPRREGLDEEDRFTENNIQVDENISPEGFVKYLVEKIYDQMLKNTNSSIMRTAYAGSGEKSVYKRYRRFLEKFYTELLTGLSDGNDFGLADGEREPGDRTEETRAIRFIEQSLIPGGNLSDLGLLYGSYYYPLSFLIALHLVVADSLVNVAKNYDSGYMKTMVEVASSDDNLLSAITGESTVKYLEDVNGMPYTYISADLGSEVTFFSRIDIRERVEELSIQLGVDRDFFIPHLKYIKELIRRTALSGAPDDSPASPTTPPMTILYRFISGVVNGDLAAIGLVLPSYLTLANLPSRGYSASMSVAEYLVAEDSPYLPFFNSYINEDDVNRNSALDVAVAMLNMYILARDPFGAGKIPEMTKEKFELEEVLRV
jgi:hypothetical protein